MTKGRLLVLDVGSSSLKAVAFDEAGQVLAEASAGYPTASPGPGAAEQDCDDWWRAAGAAIRELAAGLGAAFAPEAIALTGSMQNFVVVGPDGRPDGPAVLYSDARLTAASAHALRARLPGDFEREVGNRLDPAMSIFRAMDLADADPARLAGARALLFGAKDVLIHRMTGRAVIDPTTASLSGLFSLARRRWDPDIVAASRVPAAILPEVVPADARVGALLAEPAAELGLPAGLPVYGGAGDGGAATWGAEADGDGTPYVYLGTTGWVAATMSLAKATPPRDCHTLAAPVGEDVIVVAPFLNAGSTVAWVAELTGRPIDDLVAAGAALDPAPPALLFLPYLIGERSPFEDRTVRGGFLGLGKEHGADALAYAVLEGIAHAVRHNLSTLPIVPKRMTVIGGTRQPLLMQLIADVTNIPVVETPLTRSGTARGVYRLVAPALGFGDGAGETSPAYRRRGERAARAERRYRTYLAVSRVARDLAETFSEGQPGG